MFGNLRHPRAAGSCATRALAKAGLCTGCHAMREFSGRATSLMANHDQALLAIVAASLTGSPPVPRPCTAAPWRTVQVAPLPPALRTLLAAGNLALIDAKLCDDRDDERRMLPQLLRWLLRGKVRKAHRALSALGFDVAQVTSLPDRQRAAERERQPSIAALAMPSAELLADVFAHVGVLAGRSDALAALRRFGRAVGRAVYAFDALDDHGEDLRRGRFNAVAAMARHLGHTAAVAAAEHEVERSASLALAAARPLLLDEAHATVQAVLHHLQARARGAAAALLDRPLPAAVRPGEAGDCDCACDACGACDGPSGCDCPGGPCCDPCCDAFCLGRRGRRDQRDETLTGRR